MAVGVEPDPGYAVETLGAAAPPERAEALRRCARFQQRLAAAGDEQLLRAWLHPRDAARFVGAGAGEGAAAQRQGLLLQVSRCDGSLIRWFGRCGRLGVPPCALRFSNRSSRVLEKVCCVCSSAFL